MQITQRHGSGAVLISRDDSDIPPNLTVDISSTSSMPGVLSSSQLYSMFSSTGSDASEIPPTLPVAMPSTSKTPVIGTDQFRGIKPRMYIEDLL